MNTTIPIRRTPNPMRFLLLSSSLLIVGDPGFADDWPQFRGPLRDGVSRSKQSPGVVAGSAGTGAGSNAPVANKSL